MIVTSRTAECQPEKGSPDSVDLFIDCVELQRFTPTLGNRTDLRDGGASQRRAEANRSTFGIGKRVRHCPTRLDQRDPHRAAHPAPGRRIAGRIAALELAHKLSRFPQICMRSDRLSSYEQWGKEWTAAWQNETQRGIEVLNSGETVAGATRFAEGAGRHGADI